MGLFRTRRGLSLLAFATVMAVACVLLGLWQLDRYQQRGERNEAIRSALESPPAPLDSVVDAATTPDEVSDDVQWRTVTVRGTFDPTAELALRLRSVEGQSGVHALAPLVLDDGSAVLVDRGFVPTATRSTGEVAVPPPVDTVVELTGRVRLSESGQGSGLDSDSTPPSIRFVDLAELDTQLDDDLAPVWLERVEQRPAEDDALIAIPAPRLSAGPSLIYAVQWFLFGIVAVVGFVLLARKDSAERAARPADPGTARPAAADAEHSPS
ncbi:MAG: SURF1 family protein [Jiangellales bacterium]